MAEQAGSRVRNWLLRQALPQPDGTYLVRPFRWLPPLVYQVDAPTRERLVTVQFWYGRVMFLLVILTPLLAHSFRSWTFWGIVVTMVVTGYGGPLLVLRHAPRVPRSRWSGPAVIAPEARFTRRFYLTFFALSIVAMLTLIDAMRRNLQQPGAAFPMGLGLLTLVFGLMAARFWTLYRRSKPG
ncbi:MAG TPA: hypothetical protein VN681_00340 [Stellaceae bacterium]|nr:hypothetical protein [Stellaceae bacterium]